MIISEPCIRVVREARWDLSDRIWSAQDSTPEARPLEERSRGNECGARLAQCTERLDWEWIDLKVFGAAVSGPAGCFVCREKRTCTNCG